MADGQDAEPPEGRGEECRRSNDVCGDRWEARWRTQRSRARSRGSDGQSSERRKIVQRARGLWSMNDLILRAEDEVVGNVLVFNGFCLGLGGQDVN